MTVIYADIGITYHVTLLTSAIDIVGSSSMSLGIVACCRSKAVLSHILSEVNVSVSAHVCQATISRTIDAAHGKVLLLCLGKLCRGDIGKHVRLHVDMHVTHDCA